MTFEEFEDYFDNKIVPDKRKEIRLGQAYMLHLFHHWPVEYTRITGTENDCFYSDKRLNKTKEHLRKSWSIWPS